MIVRWQVNGYTNEIDRCEFENQVGLDEAVERQGIRIHPSAFFVSEQEAIAYLLERAERQVKIAECELSAARQTLRCLRRKYKVSDADR